MVGHGGQVEGPPERPPERGWRGVVFRTIDEKSILVSTKYVVLCITLSAFDTMLFTHYRRKIDSREYKVCRTKYVIRCFALNIHHRRKIDSREYTLDSKVCCTLLYTVCHVPF